MYQGTSRAPEAIGMVRVTLLKGIGVSRCHTPQEYRNGEKLLESPQGFEEQVSGEAGR